MYNDFKNKLLKAIELCEHEANNRKQGISGESTLEQLEMVIIPELKEILEIINMQQFPAKEKRYLNSFGSAFTVWGWNMQIPTELFIMLKELNDEYKAL